MALYFIVSARDRYGRENERVVAGPTEQFLIEAAEREFQVTDDLKFIPPVGSHVVLCGKRAADAWYNEDVDLNSARGFVRYSRMCVTVATFMPIDCVDVVSHEPEGFNLDADDGIEDKANSKDSAPTSRQNYRFWFLSDVHKLLRGERMTSIKDYAASPHADFVSALDQIEGHLFLDIETHPPTNTLQCFSFAGPNTPVYTVPVYDHRSCSRTATVRVMRALVRAMQRCVVVGHNISFDLGFLAHYHGVPWGPRIQDTMIMHHRVFPESEKSLAHVISYWVNMPYHKDTAGTFTPYNETQYQTLLRYNAADVATTRLVWQAQDAAITGDLRASVNSANASIEVYLRAGLTGFEFDERARFDEQKKLSVKIAQLNRILNKLVGYTILATSPQQLADYFYTRLKYPVLKTTDSGQPSTAADALYELAGRRPANVALRVLLELRDLNKQADMLKFNPYYRQEKR